MNYKEFKAKWLGKKTDFDKVFQNQCVDLILQYCFDVYGIKTPWVGNAITSIETGNTTLNKEFTYYKNTKEFIPEVGDVVIFNKAKSNGYYGHIAIVDEGSDMTQLYILEQNGGNGNGSGEGTNSIRVRKTDYKSVAGFFRKEVKQEAPKIVEKTGYYEEIFNKEYKGISTIYKDVKMAKEQFGDIAFFVMIGLERIKK